MFVDLVHMCSSYINVVNFPFSEKKNTFRFENGSQMLNYFLEFELFCFLDWLIPFCGQKGQEVG